MYYSINTTCLTCQMLQGTQGTVDAIYKNICSIKTARRSPASFASMCCHPHPAITCQNFAGSKLRAAHPDASSEGTAVLICYLS